MAGVRDRRPVAVSTEPRLLISTGGGDAVEPLASLLVSMFDAGAARLRVARVPKAAAEVLACNEDADFANLPFLSRGFARGGANAA